MIHPISYKAKPGHRWVVWVSGLAGILDNLIVVMSAASFGGTFQMDWLVRDIMRRSNERTNGDHDYVQDDSSTEPE